VPVFKKKFPQGSVLRQQKGRLRPRRGLFGGGGLISYHDVTSLNACAAAVDGPEVGLSKFSVSELTEPAAESLTVDDAVVRGVSQVDVDATSLALRNVVRHHSVFVIGHRFVSYD